MKRILTTGILAATLALVLASTAGATFPGKNGLLAYSDQSTGNSDIHVGYYDSGSFNFEHVTRLTTDAGSEIDPAFSPDGTKIAFVSDRDGDNEIYVMDANGSNQTRVTDNPGDDMDPAWSPDGTRLAIRRNIEGNNEIVLIDSADGGNPVNLTQDPGSDFNPDFSPDGTKIAFQRYTAGSGTGFGNEVMLMNADGTDQINLTENDNSINDGDPSFSPDGTELVFHSNRSLSKFMSYRLTLADTSVAEVSGQTDNEYREPVYSPSGTMTAARSESLLAAGEGALAIAAFPGPLTEVTTYNEVSTPSWQADDLPPVVKVTAGPAEGEAVGDPTPAFEFSSSEIVSNFECAIDDGEFAACASPYESIELEDGEHTFSVRATDLPGNVSESVTRNFTVDTTAPVLEITDHPAAISGEDTPSFSFTGDEQIILPECNWDGAGWESCASPASKGPLAEGPHTFEVRAMDQLLHMSEPVSYSWVVETVPPTVTIDSGPEDPTAEPNAWFRFSSPTESASFECRLDPGAESPWQPCVSGVGYEDLTDGSHTFEVRAVGQGAGPGIPVESSWTIDTVAPSLNLVSAPASPTNQTSASFIAEMNKPGFTLICQLDAEPSDACASPYSLTGLAPGDHTILITALDGNGEAVDSVHYNWTILANPPVAAITSGPDAILSSRASAIRFTADVPEAVFECSFDGGAWNTCTSPAVHNSSTDGAASFAVRAALPGEASGPAVDLEWTVDTTVPGVTISGGPNGRVGQDHASFSVVSDDAGAVVSCKLDDDPWQVCGSNPELTGLADGSHVFRVSVTDEAGNTGWARRDWSVDTSGPASAVNSGPESETTSRSARFTFSASEAGSTFECRVDEGAWAACTSPRSINFVELGSHRFEVRATDDLGNTGQSVSRDWEVAAPTPKGIAPTVKSFRNARVNRKGMARIAVIGCSEGRCRVTAPHRVSYRLKGRKFTPGIRSPRGFYRERNSEIMLTMSSRARKLLARQGPVRVKVRLRVESDNGKSVTRHVRITLSAR